MNETAHNKLRKLVERLTGTHIQRTGAKNFTISDADPGKAAWYSLTAQLNLLIERLGIDLVMDVGANEGQFARKLRRIYPGRIVSFEPVGETYDVLAREAAVDPDWSVHKLALGARESRQTIKVGGRTDLASILKPHPGFNHSSQFGAGAAPIREEKISIRRLDGLLDSLVPDYRQRNILLKMDTQGYDLEVFRGCGAVLDNVRVILSEISLIPIYDGMPGWLESLAEYEEHGFGVVALLPVSWIEDSRKIIEYDCLMSR